MQNVFRSRFLVCKQEQSRDKDIANIRRVTRKRHLPIHLLFLLVFLVFYILHAQCVLRILHVINDFNVYHVLQVSACFTCPPNSLCPLRNPVVSWLPKLACSQSPQRPPISPRSRFSQLSRSPPNPFMYSTSFMLSDRFILTTYSVSSMISIFFISSIVFMSSLSSMSSLCVHYFPYPPCPFVSSFLLQVLRVLHVCQVLHVFWALLS